MVNAASAMALRSRNSVDPPKPVNVVIPSVGVYSFEADYTECSGGSLSFTLGAGSGVIVPQLGVCAP